MIFRALGLVRDVPVPPPPVDRSVAARAFALLTRLRESAHDRVVSANTVTEKAVLATAECLRDVASRAERHVEHLRSLREHTVADSERSLGAVARRQIDHVEAYQGDMRKLIDQQQSEARAALESLAVITEAASQIESLMKDSRVLAINAQIEASRYGERGRAFAVVATEMRSMADQIEHANTLVHDTTRTLMARLPRMAEQVATMSDRSGRFSTELEALVADITAGAEALEHNVHDVLSTGDEVMSGVLSQTNQALSHLQFQDPVAQQLLIIDNEAHDAQKVLMEDLPAPVRVRDPVPPPLGGDTRVEQESNGEVVMF